MPKNVINCPKCEGLLKIRDYSKSSDGDLYRRRVCNKCGHTIFTIEFEVEQTEDFKKDWIKGYRQTAKEKKNAGKENY